jgi:hypothetical protein
MLNLDELLEQVAACRDEKLSIDDFEDWFRTASKGVYSRQDDASKASAAIEAAFSKFDFQGIDEPSLRGELAAAVLPFAMDTVPVPNTVAVSSNARTADLWKFPWFQPAFAAVAVSTVLICVPAIPDLPKLTQEKKAVPLASVNLIPVVSQSERMVL